VSDAKEEERAVRGVRTLVLHEEAFDEGKRMAKIVFDKRSRKGHERNVEIHIGEGKLAALLATAYMQGAQSERARTEARDLVRGGSTS
jgi:hypothetical protein